MTYPREGEVEVLRIPANSKLPLETVTVPTGIVNNNDCRNFSPHTVDLEAHLGHTPDLRMYHQEINLYHRRLQEWDGKYYVYKCVEPTSLQLPANGYFKKIKHMCVYGDVFVFKVCHIKKFDTGQKAIFGAMEEFANSFCRQGSAYDILRKMATW